MTATALTLDGGDGSRQRAILGRVALGCLIVLGGLGGPSCKRGQSVAEPPLPRLGVVEIVDVTADRPDGAPLATEILVAAVRKQLLASGLFQGDAADAGGGGTNGPGTSPVVRVRANVGVEFAEEGNKGVVRTGVRVKLDSRPSDSPGAIEDELSAGGEQLYPVGPAVIRGRDGSRDGAGGRSRLAQQLVERTLADLLKGFLARAHLRVATPAEIHAAIVGGGGGGAGGASGASGASGGNGLTAAAGTVVPGLREEAIRTAGARGLRGEVPVLLQLLQDDNEAVRDAALGALIALRERRAVTELTRNRSLRDRHEMHKILDAIAILGGDEARDYLNFVAESHEDEEIRKLAADAKSRLDRRQKM